MFWSHMELKLIEIQWKHYFCTSVQAFLYFKHLHSHMMNKLSETAESLFHEDNSRKSREGKPIIPSH